MCCQFSHVRLFATLWTAAHQAPLSMGFSGQESWSRLPWPAPGDLPDPGIKLASLKSPASAGSFSTTSRNIMRNTYIVLIFYYVGPIDQSCLTLYDPMDCNPPGSSVHEILQARILEWVASSCSILGHISRQNYNSKKTHAPLCS